MSATFLAPAHRHVDHIRALSDLALDFVRLANREFPRSDSTQLAAKAHSQSTATFTTALWLNAAVFGAEIIAFTLLRTRFQAVYEPRTYIPAENKRSPPLSTKLFGWPLEIYKADYKNIKYQNGMDAYFFVRFLRMMVKIFTPIWVASWVVLLPITSVDNPDTGKTGLDMFTFGNIGPTRQKRYAAHIIMVWLFTGWIAWTIWYEMQHFVITRQDYLVDDEHDASAQANTVLITGIPSSYLSEKALKRLFSHLPGGVRKIWLNRDLKELPDVYDKRLKLCDSLESAEIKLIKTAMELHKEKLVVDEKGSDSTTSGKGKKSDPRASSSDYPLSPLSDSGSSPAIDKGGDHEKALSDVETLVPRNCRPTHRLPLGPLPFALPLVGKKVDSIDFLREEIEKQTIVLERGRNILRREVDDKAAGRLKLGGIVGIVGKVPRASTSKKEQEKKRKLKEKKEKEKEKGKAKRKKQPSVSSDSADSAEDSDARSDDGDADSARFSSDGENENEKETYPPLNSAFVLFHQQIAAHLAAQSLTHHKPYHMSSHYIEVAPADVIWGNLGLNPYEMKIRLVISYAITIGLIVLWAFPVAFIGAVSNVSNLCETYHWLAWLCKLPKTVIGLLQGVLPPLLLAVLMMLLPIILRLLARFEGIPRRTGLELSLMTRYFAFQVIHSFLIVTLSSGLIVALPALVENPTSIPSLLATSLPQASTFFLTYTVLQGLSGTASGFLQVVPLLLYYVKLSVMGSSPRSIYNIKYTLRDIKWGTLFPATTLLAVIAIAYSVISPIINGLALLSFFLFYQMWKYLFLYQLEQPQAGDTGGLFFPKAMQHLFIGLYIQQICLAALFFLARDQDRNPSAVPEGALTVVLLGFTAIFHMIVNNSYGPLINFLPLSRADDMHGIQVKDTNESTRLIGNRRSEELSEDEGEEADITEEDARSPRSDDSGDESAGSRVVRKPVEGKQPVRGEDGEDYGASVPMEGKRNDEPTDFNHPASVEPVRLIWIPRDSLGVAKAEAKENQRMGIDSSTDHAFIDDQGHVDIDGHPPGMNADDN